jgi:hypothetical protein
MTKRLFAMAMALAMFASLALPTRSDAGTILTEATLDKTTNGFVDDLTVQYNVPINMGSFVALPSTTVSVINETYTVDSITVNFMAVTAPPTQELDFTLTSPDPGPYHALSSSFSGNYQSYLGSISVGSLPEPGSMTLLGVGMVGLVTLLAFRRLFRRLALA